MRLYLNFSIPSLLLRITISVSYLWFVADRLGLLGAPGAPHVGWGNWVNFLKYAQQTLSFLPQNFVRPLALAATVAEAGIGILLLLGIFTRQAAVASAVLSLLFALSMAISFGIASPLGYSVFTLSAASLLLATLPRYSCSFDNLLPVSEHLKKNT